ncbi:MAG: TetR/AcrR family transcriptional regulator, partial [Bacillota bacterium]
MDLNQAAGGSRVERKKEETRQKIIAAAMDLFKKQGVDATTMEQIAAEADVAKGTLYNHFPAKEAIISAYMQRSFREKKSTRIEHFRKMPDTRSRMILLIEELVDGVLEYRDIFEKYLVYRMQTMVSV